MCKGSPITNEKGTVEENGIEADCTVYLVKRLRTHSAELLDPPPKKGASSAGQQHTGQIIRVICPPNASAGSRVRISLSDGRVLQVQVPNGVSPGMPFQVALPRSNGPSQRNARTPSASRSRMIRVICPPSAGPNSVVAINIAGRGTIHVRVPPSVYPGQPFNVRI